MHINIQLNFKSKVRDELAIKHHWGIIVEVFAFLNDGDMKQPIIAFQSGVKNIRVRPLVRLSSSQWIFARVWNLCLSCKLLITSVPPPKSSQGKEKFHPWVQNSTYWKSAFNWSDGDGILLKNLFPQPNSLIGTCKFHFPASCLHVKLLFWIISLFHISTPPLIY